jgi:ASPIC and UnbV/FG-GAP-like repeat
MGRGGALFVAAAVVGWALASAAPAAGQSDGWFERTELAPRSFTLDDLGVADFQEDGDLDVFTTNHLSTQLLLANDGTGSFDDRLTAAGLNQTPAFPGWEDDPNRPPDMSEPGLYIYRESGLVLQRVGGGGTVSGEVRLLAPTTLQQATSAQVALRLDPVQQPPRIVADFSMSANSTVRLKAESSGLPLEFSIDAPFSPSNVFVGRRAVSPASSSFTLYQRDRHGMAWADFNRDGRLDIFVTRGGVSGNISRYKGVVQDELLLGDGSTFADAIAGTGISKGTCRGRAAGAVDYDDDGRLDVFADCFGESPQLYRQRPNGSFKSVSARLERDNVHGTAFEWLDVDERGRPELIGAHKSRFVVYSLRKGKWERAQTFKGRHEANAQKLTVADYDNDGDPDVFAASKTGSTLLVNGRNGLRPEGPKSAGLPSKAWTANWVDYDNDGLTDLHVIPRGLYRQGPGHRFTRAGLARPGGRAVRAIASWFDFDSNGSRDAVLAIRHHDAGRFTDLSLLDNAGPVGRWLEVELTGPLGNRQAVGAKVSARVGGRTLAQWVGQSDGSHLSQGHYRLYFGLGAATSAALKVTWPDGGVQRLGDVSADRVVRIRPRG